MNPKPAKNYNPHEFEQRIYTKWLEHNAFAPKIQEDQESYSIAIPPPNVTGVLHMGHGLNGVLQDVLIRYERMQGKATLWLPGTDHAGIATQHIVEKQLRERGQSRSELGREAFTAETWKVKKRHHAIISEQLQRLGASVDWQRERFTMDEGLSRAVREVFVRLYEEGLIYRGEYLVNWCPSCRTALADDEVEHEAENANLYELLYPFVDAQPVFQADQNEESDAAQQTHIHANPNGIVVATTRPETLFGDQAVAVHPEDPRYAHLIGQEVWLPLSDRKIPIIADRFCDMEFGSGAVKITPAHDPNDYQVAMRHNLPLLNILEPDGTLNACVPSAFRGQSPRNARKAVAEALKQQKLLLATKPHRHQVGHCYRCSAVIEPYLSKQWFLKMQPLAQKALQAMERGEPRFTPARWEATYRHWLKNIRDWCISRQLWWGHRIPAWHCAACGQISVSRSPLTHCAHCQSTQIEQDSDVLDTWFSSWLWPFSTLGWPDNTQDLTRFYPTSTLVTGYDIIFFWVARMVMGGLHFTGKVPFRDVYITPLVRDMQGRKMSKSLGNGIDPLEVIERYGADALKFSIAYLSTQGQDLPLELESFKLGSRFCNKIWNAVRFLLLHAGDAVLPPLETLKQQGVLRYETADLWLWQRFDTAVRAVEHSRAAYRFDEMSRACYEFFWNDFCDWYVEAVKLRLTQAAPESPEWLNTMAKLIEALEAGLRLLHPFVSFLTEELYACLPETYRHGELLICAPYPKSAQEPNLEQTRYGATQEQLEQFAQLQELVIGVRTLRSEFCIPPGQRIAIAYRENQTEKPKENEAEKTGKTAELSNFAHFLAQERAWVESLCKAELPPEPDFPDQSEAHNTMRNAKNAIGKTLQNGELLLFIRELIDIKKERQRLGKLLTKEEKQFQSLKARLANARFLERAPAQLVEQEKARLVEFTASIAKNREFLAQLA